MADLWRARRHLEAIGRGAQGWVYNRNAMTVAIKVPDRGTAVSVSVEKQ
jgi:hypothetical protein